MNTEPSVRLQNSLWGLFIGDALAMPAHWYCRIDNIQKVFDGGIRGYKDAAHPHLESFTNSGGDNVHRGMILGLLAGAAHYEIPDHLKQGLTAFDELKIEIDSFTDIALSGKAI
jgi:hypothetical protein